MPNYFELRKKCEAVIENNLSSTNMLSIKDFSKEYSRQLRAEKDLVFYKYFSPTYYAIRNLETDTITCNNPRAYNDIFEGMVTSLDVGKVEEVRSIIDEVCNAVSISCFSENWNNLLMYAHYADCFRGFCVEYDFSYILKKYSYCYFFPVLYQSKPSSLAQMRKLRNDINCHKKLIEQGKLSFIKVDDIISYFIHKADIWSYENEWRFIIPSPQFNNFFNEDNIASDRHYLTEFDCVSAVFLAPNIDAVHKKHICDIIERKNIDRRAKGRKTITVYQTTISDKYYSLEKTAII